MERLKNGLRELLIDEDGATMVEYALLVALVAVVAIAGVTALGDSANTKFQDAADTIGG
jgi:pilus assembly protein Flp/PilA